MIFSTTYAMNIKKFKENILKDTVKVKGVPYKKRDTLHIQGRSNKSSEGRDGWRIPSI